MKKLLFLLLLIIPFVVISQEQGYLSLYNDGYLYVGEIKEGQPHGRGTLRFSLLVVKEMEDLKYLDLIKEGKLESLKEKEILIKYIGDWKNGKREGDGIEWYSDGSWWEGKFKDGSFCMNCDGDVKFGSYFGGWIKFYTLKDGEKINENQYPMTKSNIQLREGDCEGDCDFGYGTLKKYEGSGVYMGYFKNSERNGSGIFTNTEGKYIGGFKNDLFHGEGEYFFKDGDYYKGKFRNGLENGYGIKKYLDGRVEKGNFKNGKLESEGNWTDKIDGLCKSWYKNGQLKSKGKYKDGEKNGQWKHYYEDGQLSEKVIWYWKKSFTKPEGTLTRMKQENWYNNGQIERRGIKCWDRNGNRIDFSDYLVKKYSSDDWDSIKNQE